MKRLIGISVILLGLIFFASSCAPVISKGLRAQVDKEIRFQVVVLSILGSLVNLFDRSKLLLCETPRHIDSLRKL